MIQTIGSQNFVDELTDSFAELGRDIGEAVPRILAALLILLVGYWIAKLIRRFVNSLLEKIGAGKLTRATGLEPALEQAGTSGVKLIGQVIFFLVFLIFIQLSAEALGVDQLTQLLTDLIAYLPLIVVALLVLFVAAAIANWASGIVRPFAESRNMGWVSTAVRIGILVFGVLAALDVLNLAPSVVSKVENTLLQYLPLSILLAGTIAFGVGGIKTAQQWWAKLAPRPSGGPSAAGGASDTERSSWPEQ
jgi:Conserved TM helix